MSPVGTQISGNTTSIERLETIAGIDPCAWDRLAPDDIFGSYGWLRTVEETALSRRAMHFVARERGSLVATATCSCEGPGARGIDRTLFGRFDGLARALRLGVSPALVCGTTIGLGEHVRVDPAAPPRERETLVTLLIDAMEQYAQQQSMTLCFRNVVDNRGPLAEILEHRGYLRASEMPTTFMDIHWSSFADYQRDLRRTHPATAKNIPGELNRAKKGGVIFRKLADGAEASPRLHAILDAHYRRLNGIPFPFRPEFLQTLRQNLGWRVVVYLALEAQDPIGVSVVIRSGDAAYHVMVGVDVARGRKPLVYFNNAYNVPIEDAIGSGVRRIYCGKLVYDVKTRRGFRLLDLSVCIHIPGRLRAALLRPALVLQRARIARMVRESRGSNPEATAT